ncbi:thioredoxin domain-containing protein [Streptomyces sp. GC420]|uniref:thioredoxin domain-containing protein n=1 Tax=Streptomyces sp. GC420 TaxID=2697568 RepID=UPI001414FFE6|nr:thioredoxin domain-containing protein [Streptomyces sp. GC420]NBM16277.1 thioredoxin domain-containing protein [Streptomyces sp. GC420]
MSNRNSHASKQAARERMRAERERQAKRDRTRRQLIVAGAIVGVLAIAGAGGYALSQLGKDGADTSAWDKAKDKKLVKPANTTGKDGTTVVIGKESAKKTLEIFEDPRCPVCATFEQNVGETVAKDLEAGKYKLQFNGATFLDEVLQPTGTGSKNALSALGAALDVSPEAFLDYKAALYSEKWHPEESDDKFADDDYLIEVANTVDALKDNKGFQSAVKDGTYDKWAITLDAEKFDKNKYGVQGTPSLVMDGKKVTAEGSDNAPMTPEEFNAAIDKALAG